MVVLELLKELELVLVLKLKVLVVSLVARSRLHGISQLLAGRASGWTWAYSTAQRACSEPKPGLDSPLSSERTE